MPEDDPKNPPDPNDPDGGGGAADDDDALEDLRAEVASLKEEVGKLGKRTPRRVPAKRGAGGKFAPKDDKTTEGEEGEDELRKQLDRQQEQLDRMGTRLARKSAEAVASSLDAIDAEAVVALIDFSSIEDPEDEEAVREAIEDILEARPHLVKKTTVDAARRGGRQRGKKTMNDLIRESAARRR